MPAVGKGATIAVTGANGFIAASDVAKASPDGYTVLITTNTTNTANEHLFKKLPYDPVKDYVPVTALGRGGQIMVVNPQVPAKTVAVAPPPVSANPEPSMVAKYSLRTARMFLCARIVSPSTTNSTSWYVSSPSSSSLA